MSQLKSKLLTNHTIESGSSGRRQKFQQTQAEERRLANMFEGLAKKTQNNEARRTYEHLAREWRELANRTAREAK